MPVINLLYQREYKINNNIGIIVPNVGEIIDREEDYYGLVSLLTAMPIDLMVQLEDAGVDFTSINDYELFLILFPVIKEQDTSMIFGNLDFSHLHTAINEVNGNAVIVDEGGNVIIDRLIHGQIASTLRRIHHLERDVRKPANEEAKKYMMERARIKLRRNRNRKVESQIEPLIIAMVNTEQFKYNFEETRNLSIYQFNESVRQIIHKIDYEHRMSGVYAGTIDAKSLSQDDINWLIHK